MITELFLYPQYSNILKENQATYGLIERVYSSFTFKHLHNLIQKCDDFKILVALYIKETQNLFDSRKEKRD